MNRKALNTFEKRVDRLMASIQRRPKLTEQEKRIGSVAVGLISVEEAPTNYNGKPWIELITNLTNLVEQHQCEIEKFEQKDFENRVCRLKRALEEIILTGGLNPLLVPFESRLNYLFLNPPKWFLRGPITSHLWGALVIDGNRYGALCSTSCWTEADLAVWETMFGIKKAARERVPQMRGRHLFQKYSYAEYLTSEEKAMLARLPELPRPKFYWPGPSGEEFSV